MSDSPGPGDQRRLAGNKSQWLQHHMHGAVAVSQPVLQTGAVLCGQSAILGEWHEKAGGKVNGQWQVEDLACFGRFSHPFTGY